MHGTGTAWTRCGATLRSIGVNDTVMGEVELGLAMVRRVLARLGTGGTQAGATVAALRDMNNDDEAHLLQVVRG